MWVLSLLEGVFLFFTVIVIPISFVFSEGHIRKTFKFSFLYAGGGCLYLLLVYGVDVFLYVALAIILFVTLLLPKKIQRQIESENRYKREMELKKETKEREEREKREREREKSKRKIEKRKREIEREKRKIEQEISEAYDIVVTAFILLEQKNKQLTEDIEDLKHIVSKLSIYDDDFLDNQPQVLQYINDAIAQGKV